MKDALKCSKGEDAHKKVSQDFSHANSGLGITITCLLFPVMAIYFVCDCHEVLLGHLVPQKD